MNILHIDTTTGASGDKLLGALIQVAQTCGAFGREELNRIFEALIPEAVASYEVDSKMGISGIKFGVELKSGARGHGHEREHVHEHHHHAWRDIREHIDDALRDGIITQGCYERTIKTFEIIASAEAKVHGKTIEEVSFHEVGAYDSIADIVGVSALLDALGAERVFCTPIALGYGTVKCAHGILPVPAPATALICEGLPVYAGCIESELTTPTGAALLAANVTDFEPLPLMTPKATGIGLGARNLDGAANTLRVIYGETYAANEANGASDILPYSVEHCVLLDTNIDHIPAEAIARAADLLLEAGALDVWQKPIMMKKSRLATQLNVLVRTSEADKFSRLIIQGTGSLGVRKQFLERTIVEREVIELDTEFGKIRFKAAKAENPATRKQWIRPESDDVARVARENDLEYLEVYKELEKVVANLF